MAPDQSSDTPLTAAEQRLVELLSVLSTDERDARPGFSAGVVLRARRQQDTRAALVVGSGVLAAVATGLAGLLPARPQRSDAA
jgi:hypothetical protein